MNKYFDRGEDQSSYSTPYELFKLAGLLLDAIDPTIQVFFDEVMPLEGILPDWNDDVYISGRMSLKGDRLVEENAITNEQMLRIAGLAYNLFISLKNHEELTWVIKRND